MSEEWKERQYNEIFDTITTDLEQRLAEDPEFTVESVAQMLDALYYRMGSDWEGRGEVARITMNATIAAHEHVLAEHRARNSGKPEN